MLRFVGEMLGMGSHPDNPKMWFHVIASSVSAIINGYHTLAAHCMVGMNIFRAALLLLAQAANKAPSELL